MGQELLFDGRPPKLRKTPIGPNHAIASAWAYFWRETRGTSWSFSPRDYQAIRSLLAMSKNDAPTIVRKMRRLLFDPPSAWYAQEASPALLAARWNNLEVRVIPQNGSARNAAALGRAAEEL
jgi:hypothetical protein